MRTSLNWFLALGIATLGSLSALPFGSELAAQSELQVETILEGLNQPCGVAVQPATGNVYGSESGGQKILRIINGEPQDVVVNFSIATSTSEYPFRLSPLGMAFLNEQSLAVGTGEDQTGAETLRLFRLPEAESVAINSDEAVDRARLEDSDVYSSFGLTVSPLGIYAVCLGEQDQDWIARWETDDGSTKKLTRFVNTTETLSIRAPTAVTVSPDGFITVGLMGGRSNDADSVLAFFDESTGDLKAQFPTGLRDLTALAYGPRANRLFALDFSFAEPSQAGLFKLVGRQRNTECEAIRLLNLDRPTAMAFDPAGNLYVTVLGGEPVVSDSGGKLLKISGIDFSRQAQADAASEATKKDP